MNTYTLSSEIRAILHSIEEGDAELTDETILQLDHLSKSIHENFGNIYRMIRHAAMCESSLRQEASNLTTKARRWAGVQDKLRHHAKDLLTLLKIDSYETEIGRVRLCKGPPVVQVREGFNINSLAGTKYAHLLETTTVLVGSRVKELVDRGGELPPEISIVPGPSYIRL